MSLTQLPTLPQEPDDLIYYLPINQTLVQKELIELMVQLHKKSILKSLGKIKTENSDSATDSKGNPLLNENVMLETFVSSVKQIDNHPTLLVNHFIPKNLLLLDTKENIINSSLKYVRLDEILNCIIARKKQKTIIISVSNAKELDLVESILIGKSGLQYYRFSGASLYYENHGSFDFSKNPIKPPVREHRDESDRSKSSSRSRSSTPVSHNGRGRRRRGRGGKEKGSRRGRTGGRHNASGSINSNSHNSRSKTRSSKHKPVDDYQPKISKNNPLYAKIQAEKHNKKLSIYLIMSNQLKYLAQFDELRSDFILSMDSNIVQVAPKSLQVPIVKMIIVNSLEYFDQQLKREVPSLMASPEIYNKFLTYLTVAYRSTVVTKSSNDPVSTGLIDWMMDTQHCPFPDDIRFGRFPVASLRIEDLSHRCIDSMEHVRLEQPYELSQYKFFDPASQIPNKKDTKRIKLEDLDIPADISFRQYQSYLAKMVYDRCKELEHEISSKDEDVSALHLDDSHRQYTLETNNAEIGQMYKKLRTDRTNDGSMGKHLNRLEGDKSKLDAAVKQLEESLGKYKAKLTSGVSESELEAQKNALEDLKKRYDNLHRETMEESAENDKQRAEFSAKSSLAANLTKENEEIDERLKKLEVAAKGLYQKLEKLTVEDKIEMFQQKTKSLDRDNMFLERYIDHLDTTLKERTRSGVDGTHRRGRSISPYNDI